VFISGATGPYAAAINGFFAPTLETGLDGRVVYSKCGDASVCIEHCVGWWTIKCVNDKFKSDCFQAMVVGGCSLEACTSRTWWSLQDVNSQNSWNCHSLKVENLKVETGPEVMRQVSSWQSAPLTSLPPTAPSRPFDA
jgi:hypothetical protein